ncbi:MAG: UDP-N-acetylmuramoyl-L-alanyl-D-glutamate--2,6-diaminopimelate ligase [Actinobacteria bacterium]|nr:UDP-N-acetylmuramoyl-L-alanyl-D-glutamate--2,6-diaminopimelate ligase [Actinomycetota bacterium]
MELERLIAALAPEAVVGAAAVEVRNLAYDARAVTEGAAFFCVPGSTADGHDFAAQAVENGAVALVVERALELPIDRRAPQLVVPDARAAMATAADVFFGEPTRELEVAGVTGTSGKTTTAFLLWSMLEAAGRSPGLLGTVESRIGGEVRPVVRTTPEAIDLQRTFREMLDAGNRSVALEASSHASVLHRLDRVRFDVLVFTNLSQDHLDFHSDLDDYFAAKRRLFVGAVPPPAAVNIGDEWGRRLADELADRRRAPLVSFGFADDAEIRPDDLVLDATGARFNAGGIEIRSCLRGRFNVENVLGVVAAGILLDVPEDEIAAGIETLEGVPGRFEAVDEGQSFAVVVDYSHKPDALDNVLRAARELAQGRVLVVFGAGGDRDRGKRPLMGRIAKDLADVVIVTSDNPRGEEPLAIIQDILQGAGTNVEIDPDRRAAIGRAIALAEKGDVVVIAGKGHEQGQEIAGEKLPFDDREVAREVLRR